MKTTWIALFAMPLFAVSAFAQAGGGGGGGGAGRGALTPEQIAAREAAANKPRTIASINTVWWVLVGEQLRLTLAWLDWAEAEVRSWDGTTPHGFDRRLRALTERLVAGHPILPHT